MTSFCEICSSVGRVQLIMPKGRRVRCEATHCRPRRPLLASATGPSVPIGFLSTFIASSLEMARPA